MNSIDLYDQAVELVLRQRDLLDRVRKDSDLDDFDWLDWETDHDKLTIKVDLFISNALKEGGLYVRHVGGGEGGVKTGGTEGSGGISGCEGGNRDDNKEGC